MTTLTPAAMRTLDGAVYFPRRSRGAYCGFLVGATIGLAVTGNLVGAATLYMFTPVSCLFDYAY